MGGREPYSSLQGAGIVARTREPSRRERKERGRALLAERDLAGILSWASSDPGALDLISGMISDREALIRWRAVEALGVAARRIAGVDTERLRDRIRRLIWAMNHESGNTLWLAPDAAGEIAAGSPVLVAEFARIIAYSIRLPPFERGVHRAIARMALTAPGPVSYLEPYLVHALADPDPCIRVQAALALASVRPERARAAVESLASDAGRFEAYDFETGLLSESTVGSWIDRLPREARRR